MTFEVSAKTTEIKGISKLQTHPFSKRDTYVKAKRA
jgi:hypothetical protein